MKNFFKKYFEEDGNDYDDVYCFYHMHKKKLACREGIIEFFKKRLNYDERTNEK